MSKSLHHQIVTRAREIITDPDRWMQGEFAVARDFSPADPTDAEAYRFCAVGALRRAANELASADRHLANHVQTALETFVHVRHPELEDDLEILNDEGNGHAQVLRVFDEFLAAEAV